MAIQKPATRRHFTEAARVAAAAARKRKREMRVAKDSLELFVVRASDLSKGFNGEIRRFGGVVLDRSGSSFSRVREARSLRRATSTASWTTDRLPSGSRSAIVPTSALASPGPTVRFAIQISSATAGNNASATRNATPEATIDTRSAPISAQVASRMPS